MTLNLEGVRAVVYGDVVEGTIKKGMKLIIPLNGSLSMSAVIEEIEFLDKRPEKIAHMALVLDPEGEPEETADLIMSLGIIDETLEVHEAG